jgi:hypothetical protein
MNENEKVWLITGITGQDGSFLADYLLSEGYTQIHGIIRRSSTTNTQNIDTIKNEIIRQTGSNHHSWHRQSTPHANFRSPWYSVESVTTRVQGCPQLSQVVSGSIE